MQEHRFWVYILSNKSRNLYIGVTSDLVGRIYKHKNGETPGFASRYKIDRHVYFEELPTAEEAIVREKQLKGWVRAKKIALIEERNPTWDDLSATW